jgi:hypothetical protein
MKSFGLSMAGIILAGTVLAPSRGWACSVCGLDDTAFIFSYLFMTGMPLLIVGIVGGVFIYSFRRRKNISTDA